MVNLNKLIIIEELKSQPECDFSSLLMHTQLSAHFKNVVLYHRLKWVHKV